MLDTYKQLVFIAGLFLLTTFLSCGFAYEKHVTGNYYIIGVDTKTDLVLSYKLNSGDCIGKAPGQLLQYGYNDTFLVAKTKEYKGIMPFYYIIDMTKDSDLALENIFRVGPFTEEEYNKKWKQKLNIQLQRVE